MPSAHCDWPLRAACFQTLCEVNKRPAAGAAWECSTASWPNWWRRKSSLGQRLATHCGVPFVEGDLLHSLSSIAKMSTGIPLEDIDRWPWLDAISAATARPKKGAIASCSCLRKAYRDRLRASLGPDLRLVFVDVHPDVLVQRLTSRPGHFMPSSLLASQLATLGRPTDEGDGHIHHHVTEAESFHLI
ncbi:gluconokinase, GntK/IdnK-type [Devosia sp. UYZn731]|uniref:gluconokinase n=1 Tax=Devosia sp. UYZn731 TaxID=3156345 RepID=UPI0033986D04